jgi:hypothetical protein
VVVAVGLTLIDPVAAVDVNVPGVMAMVVAPLAVQLSVLPAPALTLVGFAVNAVIAGIAPFPDDEVLDELPPQPNNPKQTTNRALAQTTNLTEFPACERNLRSQTE